MKMFAIAFCSCSNCTCRCRNYVRETVREISEILQITRDAEMAGRPAAAA